MCDKPRATVREVDGQLILDDPDAAEMFRAVEKHNCRATFDLNVDRVIHFKQRLSELGKTAADTVIVVINVDDIHGGPLAEALMPGHDWSEYWARGEVPFARGLAEREGIQQAIEIFDKEAAAELRDMSDNVAVVVIDRGVAAIFPA